VRIALDATYSVDSAPSGIAVYSREILTGLADLYREDMLVQCFRPKQYLRAARAGGPPVKRHLLVRLLPLRRADVFHALNQRADWRPARHVITTFHDLFVMTAEYSAPEFRARFTEQAKRAAENSDAIIAVSEFTARQVVEQLGVDRARIRVVFHGVHPVEQRAARERENIILFVGALQIRKNVQRLVEAFEGLGAADWHLVLAGGAQGYGAEAILRRIEASACRERIEVTGYLARDRLTELYRRAKVFAFPSLDEGFGMPVLEAMAHGVPVVTSNRSALPEVAGDAALLVDPYHVGSIAEGLERLMPDSDLRSTLIDRGLERIKAFTWERSVRETHALYEKLLA
jgi:glycosyltransferase involved in cell wall biosynthesis